MPDQPFGPDQTNTTLHSYLARHVTNNPTMRYILERGGEADTVRIDQVLDQALLVHFVYTDRPACLVPFSAITGLTAEVD